MEQFKNFQSVRYIQKMNFGKSAKNNFFLKADRVQQLCQLACSNCLLSCGLKAASRTLCVGEYIPPQLSSLTVRCNIFKLFMKSNLVMILLKLASTSYLFWQVLPSTVKLVKKRRKSKSVLIQKPRKIGLYSLITTLQYAI